MKAFIITREYEIDYSSTDFEPFQAEAYLSEQKAYKRLAYLRSQLPKQSGAYYQLDEADFIEQAP